MTKPYKVKIIELDFFNDWKKMAMYGRADLMGVSQELEALIIEEDSAGYEWVSTVPVQEAITGSAVTKTTANTLVFI